ncbi:MAG: hypothetical protein ACKPKO_14545, partial [Candidatus Fonsibacter sp.]
MVNIIVEQDSRDGHNAVRNIIGKLVVFGSNVVDQEAIKWVMGSLEDYETNDMYTSTDLSKHIVQGDKSHVGIIPLLVFKYKIIRRWLSCSCTVFGFARHMCGGPAI